MSHVTKSKKDGTNPKIKDNASPTKTPTTSKKSIFSSSSKTKADKKDDKAPSTPRTKKEDKAPSTPRTKKEDKAPSTTPRAKESTSSPKSTGGGTETKSSKSSSLFKKKTTTESPAPKEPKKSLLSKMRKSASPAPVPASSSSKPNLKNKSKGPTEGLPPIRKSKTPGPDLKKKSTSGSQAKVPSGSVELPKELLDETEKDLKKKIEKSEVEETGRASMDSVDSNASKKKKKKRTFSFSGLTRKGSQSSLLSEGKEPKEEIKETSGKEKKKLTNKILGKFKITKNKSKDKGSNASDLSKLGDEALGLDKEKSDQDSVLSYDRSASENQSFSNTTGTDTVFVPASEPSETNYADAVEAQMSKLSFTTKSSRASEEVPVDIGANAKEMKQEDDKKMRLKTPEFEMLSDEEKEVIHQDTEKEVLNKEETSTIEKTNIEKINNATEVLPKEEIVETKEEEISAIENASIEKDETQEVLPTKEELKEEISPLEETKIEKVDTKEEIIEEPKDDVIEIKEDEPKIDQIETKVDELKDDVIETKEELKDDVIETKVDEPKIDQIETKIDEPKDDVIEIKEDEPKVDQIETKVDESKVDQVETNEEIKEDIIESNEEPKVDQVETKEEIKEDIIETKADEPKEEILPIEKIDVDVEVEVEDKVSKDESNEKQEEILETPYKKQSSIDLYDKVTAEKKEPINYNDIKISQDFSEDCVPKASIDIFHAPAMDALVTAEVEGSLMMPTIFDKFTKSASFKKEDSDIQIQDQTINQSSTQENKQDESSVFIPINYPPPIPPSTNTSAPVEKVETVIDEFEKDSLNEPKKSTGAIELLTAVDIGPTVNVEKKGEQHIETKLSELSDRAESYTTVIVASDRSEIDDFVKEEILAPTKREVVVDKDETLSSGNDSIEAIVSDDDFDKMSETKLSEKSNLTIDDDIVENDIFNVDDNSKLTSTNDNDDDEVKRRYYPSFSLSKAGVSDDEDDEIITENNDGNNFGSDFSLRVKTAPHYPPQPPSRTIKPELNMSMYTFPDATEDLSPSVKQQTPNAKEDVFAEKPITSPQQNIGARRMNPNLNLSMHTFADDLEPKSPTCQSPQPTESPYNKKTYDNKKSNIYSVKETLSSDMSMDVNDGFENISRKSETEDDISIREYTPEVSMSMKLETKNSGIDDNLSDVITKDTPFKSSPEISTTTTTRELKDINMQDEKGYHGYRDDISDLSCELLESSSGKDVNVKDGEREEEEEEEETRESISVLESDVRNKNERYVPGAPEGISDLSSVDDGDYNEMDDDKADDLMVKKDENQIGESGLTETPKPILIKSKSEIVISQRDDSEFETSFLDTKAEESAENKKEDVKESKELQKEEEEEEETFTSKDRSIDIMELIKESTTKVEVEESIEEDVTKEKTSDNGVEEMILDKDANEGIKGENEVGAVAETEQALNVTQDDTQGNVESKPHFEDISDQKRNDEDEEISAFSNLTLKTKKDHDETSMEKIDKEEVQMLHSNRPSVEDRGFDSKAIMGYVHGYDKNSRRKSFMSTTSSKNERTSICDYVVPGSPTKSVVSLAKQELIEEDLHQGCEKIAEMPELSTITPKLADKSKALNNDKSITDEWLRDAYQARPSNQEDGTSHHYDIAEHSSEVKPCHPNNEEEALKIHDSIPQSASSAALVQQYKMAKEKEMALEKAKQLAAAESSKGGDKGKNKSSTNRGIINILLLMTTLTVTTIYAILIKKPFSSAPDP